MKKNGESTVVDWWLEYINIKTIMDCTVLFLYLILIIVSNKRNLIIWPILFFIFFMKLIGQFLKLSIRYKKKRNTYCSYEWCVYIFNYLLRCECMILFTGCGIWIVFASQFVIVFLSERLLEKQTNSSNHN